jgi:hypothetical protein
MTKKEKEAIASIRNKGFAVIVWYPEELRGVAPKYVEEGSIQHGHSIIDELATESEEDN